MRFFRSYIKSRIVYLSFIVVAGVSCKKDGNPNNLPDVSPDAYVGTIDGYHNYRRSVSAKTKSLTGALMIRKMKWKVELLPLLLPMMLMLQGELRGKALSLTAGYIYYATQFPKVQNRFAEKLDNQRMGKDPE